MGSSIYLVTEYMDEDIVYHLWKHNWKNDYGASGAPSSAFYSQWSGPRNVVGPYTVMYI